MAEAAKLKITISADDRASGVLGRLQNSMGGLRKAGMALTAAGGLITAGFYKTIQAAATFETSITNAASVTGYAGEEFTRATERMGELAQMLGRTTVFTASQAANAMYDLASKGFLPAEMSIKELKPFLDLAAATMTDLTFATEAVTSSLRAFGLETIESKRIADVFTKVIGSTAATMEKLSDSMGYVGPIAKAAGLSIEETSAALGTLYNIGLKASMAGTALRGVLTELMSPSAALEDVLARLGLTVADISLTTNTFTGALKKLDEAGISSAEMVDIFGKRAGPAALALISMTDQGIKAYEAMEQLSVVLGKAGDEAARVADIQLNTLEGQLKLLKSAFESVTITIGEVFIPALSDMATKVTEVTRGISTWVKTHPLLTKGLSLTTAGVGVLMLAVGPLLIALPFLISGFTTLTALVSGLGLLLPALAVGLAGIGMIGYGVYLLGENRRIIAENLAIHEKYYELIQTYQKEYNKAIAGLENNWRASTQALIDYMGTFKTLTVAQETYLKGLKEWISAYDKLVEQAEFKAKFEIDMGEWIARQSRTHERLQAEAAERQITYLREQYLWHSKILQSQYSQLEANRAMTQALRTGAVGAAGAGAIAAPLLRAEYGLTSAELQQLIGEIGFMNVQMMGATLTQGVDYLARLLERIDAGDITVMMEGEIIGRLMSERLGASLHELELIK